MGADLLVTVSNFKINPHISNSLILFIILKTNYYLTVVNKVMDCFECKEKTCFQLTTNAPCVITQYVSRWLPATMARFRGRVMSCVIWGGQSGAVAGFLRVLRFSFSLISTTSYGAGTIFQKVADVPSGLSSTPPPKYFVAWVRQRTILTERLPLVSEVSANFCW
jgi:hypothetical protein